MHFASIGNADRICCICNLQIIFSGFFTLFAAHCLLTEHDSVRASIGNPHYKREKFAPFFLFMTPSPINFALRGGNGNKPNKRRWQN